MIVLYNPTTQTRKCPTVFTFGYAPVVVSVVGTTNELYCGIGCGHTEVIGTTVLVMFATIFCNEAKPALIELQQQSMR